MARPKGYRHTLETRRKLSVALTGRRLSPEHRQAIGSSLRATMGEIRARATVDPETGCWFGFGHMFYRRTYELAHGPVPSGLCIDHLCGNGQTAERGCCANPDHLEAVTPGENTRRGGEPHFHCRGLTWPEWERG